MGEKAFEVYIVTWLVEHGGYRRVKFGDADDKSDFVSAARVRSDVSRW